MIKISDKSLLKPLTLLFRKSAKLSYYPDIWKRFDIIPVHEKNDEQLIKSYRPISLLHIFRKNFEKTINQSAITHKIFETNSSFYVKQCTTGKV